MLAKNLCKKELPKIAFGDSKLNSFLSNKTRSIQLRKKTKTIKNFCFFLCTAHVTNWRMSVGVEL